MPAAKARPARGGEARGRAPQSDPPRATPEAAALLTAWFEANARDLPWRKPADSAPANAGVREPAPGYAAPPVRRDPYAVWIAEIMLQQTQVATVIAYFNRWMSVFPDVASLARAREEEVLAQWAGLGYYSRARNLLDTARRIVGELGGAMPWRRADLLGLKGIGEYTAGAIASLAYGQAEPILDGNLVRVFSRLYGLAFLPESAAQREGYWSIARSWAGAARSPALVNEGLMELGALVCLPRGPRCGDCPLAGGCAARARGLQESLPPAKARKAAKEIAGTALVALRGGDVLLWRPPKGELLAGLLTFPVLAAAGLPAVREAWQARLPGHALPELRPRAGRVTHAVMHNQFRLSLVEARLAPDSAAALPAGHAWVPAGEVEARLVSSLPRKIWRAYTKA